MLDAVAEMVDAKGGASSDSTLPDVAAPVIAVSAKAGRGVTAADAVELSVCEKVVLMSGRDTKFLTGGGLRTHTCQAIGVLAGAVKPGESSVGLQVAAARGAVDGQAQAAPLDVQARDDLHVVGANTHVDWAAAKRISLSTVEGANITIEGGILRCSVRDAYRSCEQEELFAAKATQLFVTSNAAMHFVRVGTQI